MPRSSSVSLAALAAAVLCTACTEGARDTHPQQLVTKRQAVFKDFTRTLEPMVLTARDRKPYNPSELMSSALELQRLSTLPWEHFTADGNYPPTRAKPEVWQQPAEFKAAQQVYLDAVQRLVTAAQAGDIGLVRPAVGAVEKSCKACHDGFRNTKPAT